jgi:hypothetical protein
VLAARWYVNPASPSNKDKKIADFVSNCLFKWQDMTWPQQLSEILIMMDFGFSAFVKVWKQQKDGLQTRVVWKELSPRHPLLVDRFFYDDQGQPDYFTMFDPNYQPGSLIEIPVDRSLVFSFDKEGGDFEGVSVLRSAYQNWYYKNNLLKVDAIQKERHGIGIPLIYLPAGFNNDDKSLADEIGRNLRTNEKAHVVLPFNWKIEMLKLEGNLTNALESAQWHDMMIARNILGQFLNHTGGNATQTDIINLFTKATRYIADIIRDVFNKWAIPELVNFNFAKVTDYPELKVRRIGDTTDWRTISFAIRNFIGAGVIQPDDPLEAWIRDEMDLPIADPATIRQIIPQGPPDANPGPGGAATAEAHQNQGMGRSPKASSGPLGQPKPGLPRQSAPGPKPVQNNGGSGQDRSGK